MAARSKKSQSNGSRRKVGRPRFVATEDQRRMVEAMAGYGVPEEDIALVVVDGGIHSDTLRKYFRLELSTGHIRANAKVAESLYKRATGDGKDAVVAAIFWLKTRARWREPPKTVFLKPIGQMSEYELLETLGGEPDPEELSALAGVKTVGSA